MTRCVKRAQPSTRSGNTFRLISRNSESSAKLRDEIQELRDSGATPEEIREYLDQKAEELGIELAFKRQVRGFGGFKGASGRGRGFFRCQEG